MLAYAANHLLQGEHATRNAFQMAILTSQVQNQSHAPVPLGEDKVMAQRPTTSLSGGQSKQWPLQGAVISPDIIGLPGSLGRAALSMFSPCEECVFSMRWQVFCHGAAEPEGKSGFTLPSLLNTRELQSLSRKSHRGDHAVSSSLKGERDKSTHSPALYCLRAETNTCTLMPVTGRVREGSAR